MDGKKVALFSTVTTLLDGHWSPNETKMTSPDPFVLGKFLVSAKKAGAEYIVIETSSHALFYNRIYGIDYDVAVFTNLSQDHLDLHGTMEEYRDIKLRLFKNLSYGRRKKGIKKVSVVNIDDPWSAPFLEATVDTLYTFGALPNAQIRALDITPSLKGTDFHVKMPAHTFSVSSSFRGGFNVMNMLAAIGVLVSQKVDTQTIQKTLESMS